MAEKGKAGNLPEIVSKPSMKSNQIYVHATDEPKIANRNTPNDG